MVIKSLPDVEKITILWLVLMNRDYPIKCQCCPHVETSQLICKANQLTGFYMRATLALNGLSDIFSCFTHGSQSNNCCTRLSTQIRGGSRAATTSKMECFVIIVNGFQPLTIITKHSILDVAAALDPPLGITS